MTNFNKIYVFVCIDLPHELKNKKTHNVPK